MTESNIATALPRVAENRAKLSSYYDEIIYRDPGPVLRDERLVVAAGQGVIERVERLLKFRAQANSDDSQALRLAAAGGHNKIIDLLIENGADVHAEEDTEYGALAQATEYGHITTVELLLKKNPSERARSIALGIAREKGQDNLAQLLEESCEPALSASVSCWSAAPR